MEVHPRNGWLMTVRLQCNRTLRRWLCRLRKPKAIRAASWTILFADSVRALVMPVLMNATRDLSPRLLRRCSARCL
jgi:hypothetical protein